MPKGIKGFQKGHKGFIPKERYPEIAKKISVANKGKIRTAEQRARVGLAQRGRKHTEEHRRKVGEGLRAAYASGKRLKIGRVWTLEERLKAKISHLGSKAPAWKGGISSKNHLIRSSMEYRMWRAKVFARDHYTCQHCGMPNSWDKKLKKRTGIHAHHIRPFSLFPELRFEVSNGLTLCIPCHRKVDHSKLK